MARILLIEDNLVFLNEALAKLHTKGFETKFTSYSDAALEFIEKEQFNGVLSDLSFPKNNTLCDIGEYGLIISKKCAEKGIPCVICTFADLSINFRKIFPCPVFTEKNWDGAIQELEKEITAKKC